MNQRRSPPTAPTEWPSDTSAVPPPTRVTCTVPRRPAPSGTGFPCCTISTVFQSPASILARRAISVIQAELSDCARADEVQRTAPQSSQRINAYVTLSLHMTISLASLASDSPRHKQSDWGAPAARVLVVASRDDGLSWRRGIRKRLSPQPTTRAACAPRTSVSSAACLPQRVIHGSVLQFVSIRVHSWFCPLDSVPCAD